MKRVVPEGGVNLVGFNNLTKALSFNLYDFCVARNESERRSYIEYVAERFNARRVTETLRGICNIIEAQVLAVSDQDYEPWGASSLVLMSDLKGGSGVVHPKPQSGAGVAMHLDKSHVCAHTYPDFQSIGGTGSTICSFRIDIDIATCGEISPLNALNYMFERFESDVVVIDYVVRGFTRDESGRRIYMDHQLNSITEYIAPHVLADYRTLDLQLGSYNIWQTKMLRVRQDVGTYFRDPVDPEDPQVKLGMEQVNREMRGVLHMWPE
jgi:S-adenosylmethionine decarboxylase